MSHHGSLGRSLRVTAATATTLSVLLLGAACGNQAAGDGDGKPSSNKPSASSSAASLPEADGTWLVALTTAEGADAETTSVTYLGYNPTTGAATARKVPGIAGGTGDGVNGALLVSTDRKWALPDLDVARQETQSGQVTVYSTTDETTKKVDLRQLTASKDLKPVAHAFDPQRPEVLRVVDTGDHVWAVDLATDTATSEGRLAQGPWVFTNGFNHNTGVPWVESVDSDETEPPGNGVADTAPVQRAGGTVLYSGSDALTALPKNPCGLSGGFTTAEGTSWVFCADKPEITAYALPKGATEWQAVGKPSAAIAPAAAGVPLVLPPAS